MNLLCKLWVTVEMGQGCTTNGSKRFDPQTIFCTLSCANKKREAQKKRFAHVIRLLYYSHTHVVRSPMLHRALDVIA